MKAVVTDRVLHLEVVKDASEIPFSVKAVFDAYEGMLPGRIGCNAPMAFIQSLDKKHPFFSPYFSKAEYVILYRKGDVLTKKHELQHAKYHMNAEFRLQVHHQWNSLSEPMKKKITLMLKKMNYSDEVLLDEFQAYYYTEKMGFFGKETQAHDRS
jgi:hypothetical protein